MNKKYIIVGSGTAGLNAFRALKNKNEDVMLIGNDWKTTCAHVGCMPSKAFIAETKRTRDYQKSIRYAQQERDRFVSYVLEDTPCGNDVIHGDAYSRVPGEIVVNDQTFHYEHLIIATGSSIREVPDTLRGHNYVFDKFIRNSDSFFNKPLDANPQKVLVIGTGVIGLELGNAIEQTGANVTYVSHKNTFGILSNETLKNLHQKQHNVIIAHNIHSILESNNQLLIDIHSDNGYVRDFYDLVIWAAGRQPNTHWLQWDYTTDKNVHCIGDVNQERPLLHEAAHQGKNIHHIINHSYGPETSIGIVFSYNQQAVIGDKNDVHSWKEKLWNNQGRSRLEHTNIGGCVLGFNEKNTLVYAEILHPQAEHLAHFLLLAISEKYSIEKLKKIPFYHPTIYEGLKNML